MRYYSIQPFLLCSLFRLVLKYNIELNYSLCRSVDQFNSITFAVSLILEHGLYENMHFIDKIFVVCCCSVKMRSETLAYFEA